jgi:hypothetical protein
MHEESTGTEPIYAQPEVRGTNIKPVLISEWEFTVAFSSFYLKEIWNQFCSYNEGLLCTETPTH